MLAAVFISVFFALVISVASLQAGMLSARDDVRLAYSHDAQTEILDAVKSYYYEQFKFPDSLEGLAATADYIQLRKYLSRTNPKTTGLLDSHRNLANLVVVDDPSYTGLKKAIVYVDSAPDLDTASMVESLKLSCIHVDPGIECGYPRPTRVDHTDGTTVLAQSTASASIISNDATKQLEVRVAEGQKATMRKFVTRANFWLKAKPTLGTTRYPPVKSSWTGAATALNAVATAGTPSQIYLQPMGTSVVGPTAKECVGQFALRDSLNPANTAWPVVLGCEDIYNAVGQPVYYERNNTTGTGRLYSSYNLIPGDSSQQVLVQTSLP